VRPIGQARWRSPRGRSPVSCRSSPFHLARQGPIGGALRPRPARSRRRELGSGCLGKVRRQIESPGRAAQASKASWTRRSCRRRRRGSDFSSSGMRDCCQTLLTQTMAAYQTYLDITRNQYEAVSRWSGRGHRGRGDFHCTATQAQLIAVVQPRPIRAGDCAVDGQDS